MYSVNMDLKRKKESNCVFELWSDLVARKFPTYKLDSECRFVSGPDTETVNFADLKELLLSRDLKRYHLLEQMTANGKCAFLDGNHDMSGNKVAL